MEEKAKWRKIMCEWMMIEGEGEKVGVVPSLSSVVTDAICCCC